MPDYVATTPGLYPLPDWSKDDLSSLKGHQKNDLVSGNEGAEITAVYDDVREELIDRQQAAGLDRIVEGQARWDDMLAHPLAVHDAVETRGLVRYYDNNNFYREPVVTGDLTPNGDIASDLEAATELADTCQAVIPGPYSLFDLGTDEYYGNDRGFLGAIADFLAGELEACPPIDTVFLLEPSIATAPPGPDLARPAADAVEQVGAAANADVVVHSYWGAPDESIHGHLLDVAIDAIGYDLVTSPTECFELVEEFGTTEDVALGVVDGQNTAVESPASIRDQLAEFEDRVQDTDPDTVYVTSNTELFYLPVNRFGEKLDAIAGATKEEVVA